MKPCSYCGCRNDDSATCCKQCGTELAVESSPETAVRKGEISNERRLAYYAGGILMVLGFLTFGSVFVTGAMHFGDFSHFESDAKSSMVRAILGMAMVAVGGVIRGIGARGLAGSGVILNPRKAREELAPYSQMAGGMIKDALDEAKGNLGQKGERVVMIKCPSCGKLNEEDSKFCQECGKKL